MRVAIHNLKNKWVLVTGAASGIGRSAVMAFAKRGAHIIASDVNQVGLDAVKKEVEALGVFCLIHMVDVSNEAAMKEFADKVHDKCGAIDVLINNAGVAHIGRFLDCDIDHWQRVIGINIMGVVHGCHFFIPKMIEAGGPRQVLNVSSMGGIYPSPNFGAYCSSKGAVWNLSEVLKMELVDTQVGVTTVCPGLISTSIAKHAENSRSAKITDERLAKVQNLFQKEGCSPDVVGEAMVRAVQSGKDMLLTGPHARFIHHARRISLGMVRKTMIALDKKSC
jgi:short-subunit dehydrogenase